MKGFDDAVKLVDATFIGQVLKGFNAMHKAKNDAMGQLVKMEEEGEFPIII